MTFFRPHHHNPNSKRNDTIRNSSLGVHISFVRSIAMDSWTDQQLKLMKIGGNDNCNAYLQKHGIASRTPIKQKYESPAAQLYKEVLKARAEGRPEPTQLPPPVAARKSMPSSAPPSLGGGSSHHSSGGGGGDANGMERLPGETEQQYVARQIRLRDEARARMQAKFGGAGMSGVGSSGGGMNGGGGGGGRSRMQGIGSDSSYNPHTGGYGNGGAGGGDLFSSFGTMVGQASSMASAAAKSLQDEQTVQSLKSTGASFWSGLTSSVSQVASSMAAPEDSDGLAELQRQVASQKPTQSKYAGFGSSDNNNTGTSIFSNNNTSRTASQSSFGSATSSGMSQSSGVGGAGGGGAGGVQEAPGLPGEDRNGVERLTGETDEQYVMRQTRLRDEARARMTAKFGGSGMGGIGSSGGGGGGNMNGSGMMSGVSSAPVSSGGGGMGNSGMMPRVTRPATTTPAPTMTRSAPSSGNAPNFGSAGPRSTTPPAKQINSDDFFSSFGT